MALTQCFNNYITIDGIAVTPVSGIYINRFLRGFTLTQADKLRKDDQSSRTQWWNELYEASVANFIIDIRKKVHSDFLYDAQLIAGETSDYETSVSTATGLGGVIIKMPLTLFSEMRILRAQFKVDQVITSPPNLNIEVRQKNATGELLDTIFVDAVQDGLNYANIYKSYDEEELFIGLNHDDISVHKTTNSDNWKVYHNSCLEQANTAFITQVNTGGLNVEFNISCSIEKFICSRITYMKGAFAYRIGMDIMAERLSSDRINRFTTITPERAEQLMQVYGDQYEKALKSLFPILTKDDPICMNCKSVVKSETLIP